MSKKRFTPLSLALAAAIGTAAIGTTAPAAAQSPAASSSSQQIAESLVTAINGRRADRRNWGHEHVASDRIRDAEVAKLDRLAIRYGELTLNDVNAEDGKVQLSVADARGRTGTIELLMDANQPGSVLGLGISGF